MSLKKYLGDVYNKTNIASALKKVDENYSPHSADKYLYNLVLTYNLKDKFSPEFMELLYATLDAWGMNSRGAGLKDFDEFCKLVQNQRESILKLADYDIKRFCECKEPLEAVFTSMQLSKSKSQLVTTSKVLHFLLPNLVVPVDRNYTLNFYHGSTYIPENVKKQFDLFSEIHTDFSNFASKIDLNQYITQNSWKQNITGILDSLVIAQNLQY